MRGKRGGWDASHKGFKPKEGSGDGDGANFDNEKRGDDTHASTADPESRLYRKAAGREAKLCYMGDAPMENRNGLAVGGTVTQAAGKAEREASEAMLARKVEIPAKRSNPPARPRRRCASDHQKPENVPAPGFFSGLLDALVPRVRRTGNRSGKSPF